MRFSDYTVAQDMVYLNLSVDNMTMYGMWLKMQSKYLHVILIRMTNDIHV